MKAMRKVITGKHGIHTVEVERADWSIRFYSFETRRHATRRVWNPVHGSDVYVQYAGKFWLVCTDRDEDGGYDPWLVIEYSEGAPEPEAEVTPEAPARDLGEEAVTGRVRRADGTEVRVPSSRTLKCGCRLDLARVVKALFGAPFPSVVSLDGGTCLTYSDEFGPCRMSDGLFVTRGEGGRIDWSRRHRFTVLWDDAVACPLGPSVSALDLPAGAVVVYGATLDGERVI